MEPRKVVLVVDNPIRDLYGIIILALYLSSHNIKCYLVSMNDLYNNKGEEIWRICPDFVLLNYMRVNNQWLIKRLVDAEVSVGVLDTEGGVLVNLESYKDTFMTDIDLARHISVYFSWGRVLGNYLVEEGLLSEKQLAVTGSPRFDFYSAPLSDITKHDKTNYFNNSNPTILINSNFPIANPQFQTPEEEKSMLVNVFNMNPLDVDQMIGNQQKALEEFLKVSLELAEEYPEINFFYRPHPFENEKIYHSKFLDKPNIVVSKEGPVLNQIAKSALIIHRSCSTAIEAQLIGKPAFSLKWVPCFKEQPLSEAVSIGCLDYQDLKANIESVLNGTFKLPIDIHGQLENIGKDWFSGFDGKAHLRVGNQIVKIAGSEKKPSFSKSVAEYEKAAHYSLKDRFKGILYLALNLQSNWSLKKYLKGVSQEKNTVYSLSAKERILWLYTYLFNINKRKTFFGLNGKSRIQKQLWMSSEKFFSADQVKTISEKILQIQKNDPDAVIIRTSLYSDFVLGEGEGSSVIMEQQIYGK